MWTFLNPTWALGLLTVAACLQSELPRPEPWARILSLMDQGTAHGNAESVDFLKSLTPEEMLSGARQACREVAAGAGQMQDMPPPDVAILYVTVCLTYYFEKTGIDDGSRKLLDITRDTGEPPFLRQALIHRMGGKAKTQFQHTFQIYINGHWSDVYGTLERVLEDRQEDALVRKKAMRTIALQLGRQAAEMIDADPNLRKALQEKRRHTGHVLFPRELVRSGEVTLTEETMNALALVEGRTVAYVKLLGAILADKRNEPVDLWMQAKRTLEGYRKSALTGIDDEVEKALRPTGR